MIKTVSVYKEVCVDVDVELADIDIDDLREELASRTSGALAPAEQAGLPAVPPLRSDEKHPLHEIYYALKFGLNERAAELTRAYVCNELGVIL